MCARLALPPLIPSRTLHQLTVPQLIVKTSINLMRPIIRVKRKRSVTLGMARLGDISSPPGYKGYDLDFMNKGIPKGIDQSAVFLFLTVAKLLLALSTESLTLKSPTASKCVLDC